MRILVTRPIEDALSTAQQLRKLGHEPIVCPLLSVQFREGVTFSVEGVQAIIATSMNGIRALVHATSRRDIPIFAVGSRTADAARDAGFAEVKNSASDSAALADAIARWTRPEKGALLHVSGSEVAGTLVESLSDRGFQVRREILYDMVQATRMPKDVCLLLSKAAIGAVLLYSPRSAEIFSQCMRKAGLIEACRNLIAVCISEAAAEKCRGQLPMREFRVARNPTQSAMLEALKN